MMNRITAAIAAKKLDIDGRITARLTTTAKVKEASKTLDMDVMEHAKFQELKTLAVANGLLTVEEGQSVYVMLGTTSSVFNRQHVAVKAVLTGLFQELLTARINAASQR
jgi:hypothetical protein